jgi:hypothetical protein
MRIHHQRTGESTLSEGRLLICVNPVRKHSKRFASEGERPREREGKRDRE